MNIKIKKRLMLAIFVSVCFMVILLMKVDWEHFLQIAERLKKKYILSSFCMFSFGNFVRTLRFRKLDHTRNRVLRWWNINALYNVVTATLPGGAGDATTAYILKRSSMFDILGAFRILLLSRLQDLFAISSLFFVSACFIGGGVSYRNTAVWISGVMSLVSLIAFLPPGEQFVLNLLKRIPGQNKWIRKAYEKLTELLIISEEQRSGKSTSVILFQSIVMATSGILSVHLLLKSMGVDFSYVQSAYCYGAYMIFKIIPVQGIAGIGTQAAWWTLSLKIAGFHDANAIAVGFVLYGVFYLFIAFWGLVSLLFWLKGKEKK
jgi:hypothetical protein